MFIYLTINLINGKKYIGLCDHKESGLYLGSGKILKRAIKKYGRENFERTILEECNTREELEIAEKKWIEEYNAVVSDDFYNIADGGHGGNSVAVKKYWDSLSVEERKDRNKHIKYRYSPGFKGKTHSEESRKMIGTKSKDRHWSKGEKHSLLTKGTKNGRAKKVLVEDNNGIQYFDCLKDYADIHPEYCYGFLKKLAQLCTIDRKIINTKGKHSSIKRLIYYERTEDIDEYTKIKPEVT